MKTKEKYFTWTEKGWKTRKKNGKKKHRKQKFVNFTETTKHSSLSENM